MTCNLRIAVVLIGSVSMGTTARAHDPVPASQQVVINDVAVSAPCSAVGVGSSATCITQQIGPEVLRDIAKSNAATAGQIKQIINAALDAQKRMLEHKLDLPDRAQLQVALEKSRVELAEWVAKAQALEAVLQGPELAPALELLRQGDLSGAEQALVALRTKQRLADSELEKRLLEHKRAAADAEYALGTIHYLRWNFEQAAPHLRAAIRQYRRLRAEGDTGIEVRRAGALRALAVAYRRMKRPDEAERAAHVAVGICRALTKSQPETFRAALANALITLADIEISLGHHSPARAAVRELVDTERILTASDPDHVFLRALGEHLRVLSALEMDREERIKSHREAISVYRKLEEREPLFVFNLGSALYSLGITLQFSDWAGSVSALREAVDAFHRLREREPEWGLPRTAMVDSLIALATSLKFVRDQRGAAMAARDAVTICRETHADSSPRQLVSALGGLAHALDDQLRQMRVVTHDERVYEVKVLREVVDVYRELSEINPEVHRPALIARLEDLALALTVLGERDAAAEVGQAVARQKSLVP